MQALVYFSLKLKYKGCLGHVDIKTVDLDFTS